LRPVVWGRAGVESLHGPREALLISPGRLDVAGQPHRQRVTAGAVPVVLYRLHVAARHVRLVAVGAGQLLRPRGRGDPPTFEVGLVVEVELAGVLLAAAEEAELGVVLVERVHVLEAQPLASSLAVVLEVGVAAGAVAVADVRQGDLAAVLAVAAGAGGGL